jgi:endonuclease-3
VKHKYHIYVREITSKLIARFGNQSLGNKRNPFNEFLYILLSSKTPPTRYREIYSLLKRHFPKNDQLAVTNWKKVAKVIKNAGLQNRKARAITKTARILLKKFGRVTLSPLRKLADNEIEIFLISLPEINKKIARCIMVYSLDRDTFPVDSHCLRVSQRVGWINPDSRATDDIADFLQDGIPKGLRKDLHIGMVLLGRSHCTPSNPNCNSCPLNLYCNYWIKHSSPAQFHYPE